ncbi:hypothetical protein [Actinoplanes friuliensis]|nr:hypothetical protein [Actinoplanes friuliensis]
MTDQQTPPTPPPAPPAPAPELPTLIVLGGDNAGTCTDGSCD